MRDGTGEVLLADSIRGKFVLTREPDPYLARVDEASAVARLMLKGFAGKKDKAEFSVAVASSIEEIKAERRKKIGSKAVLVFQADGEIEAVLKDSREHEGFIVAFDVVEKRLVRERHQPDIEAMKTAVAFESDTPSRFADLADGTYLRNDAGKAVYSISFSMSAEASLSSSLSEGSAKRISTRYASLNQLTDLDSVERLFSQMADHDTDRLKAFLSGWAALEILIGKLFKRYEQEFLSPFTKADQSNLRERFLERIRGVMKDKYRLTDKFIAVTAVLFPQATDDEVKSDYEKFCKLKELRDSIFHGEPFSEKNLPVYEIASVLRKYVLARISTPDKAPNAGTPSSGGATG